MNRRQDGEGWPAQGSAMRCTTSAPSELEERRRTNGKGYERRGERRSFEARRRLPRRPTRGVEGEDRRAATCGRHERREQINTGRKRFNETQLDFDRPKLKTSY